METRCAISGNNTYNQQVNAIKWYYVPRIQEEIETILRRIVRSGTGKFPLVIALNWGQPLIVKAGKG